MIKIRIIKVMSGNSKSYLIITESRVAGRRYIH